LSEPVKVHAAMATRKASGWVSALVGIALAAGAETASAQGSVILKIEPAPLTLIKPPEGGLTAMPTEPPPYDEQLLRLSEILGALHYLRQLCGSGEGSLWRDEMQALIDSEARDETRKARFVDRFNRGYDSFRAVYRTCTPAATTAIDRYIDEGARIARDVAVRYGREK
jgi:uncharacterized protein (TIGR02301 family)